MQKAVAFRNQHYTVQRTYFAPVTPVTLPDPVCTHGRQCVSLRWAFSVRSELNGELCEEALANLIVLGAGQQMFQCDR